MIRRPELETKQRAHRVGAQPELRTLKEPRLMVHIAPMQTVVPVVREKGVAVGEKVFERARRRFENL